MKIRPIGKTILSIFFSVILIWSMIGTVDASTLFQDTLPPTNNSQIEVVNPYYTIEYITTADGSQIAKVNIHGNIGLSPDFQAKQEALMTTSIEAEKILPDFPSYDWVFGCSSVAAAMIAAYYDQGSYPNIYTGPTNGGVMPLTDDVWPEWTDSHHHLYPNIPLVASHMDVDGRTIKGSIDDYWLFLDSSDPDPYITGGWQQHEWGTAIGDYMKTSQSAYWNWDGSTYFHFWLDRSDKLTCAQMKSNGDSFNDGTYGIKLFYEARGYQVTECYNQVTDNQVAGGFSLDDFKSEIDSGYPVLLHVQGHSLVGYGYDGSTIYIRDTWDSDPSHIYTMQWGGDYIGLELVFVSIVHLAGSNLPYKNYIPLIERGQ